MKISRILITALILICAIGIVSATDINKLQMPSDFTNAGGGTYANDPAGVEIDVYKDHATDFIKNDSSLKYTVVPGKIKNTFNFTDETNNMTGIVEIVKIDDKPVAITIWGDIGGKNTDLEKFTSQLEEVNKLNKLEPVDASTLCE